MNPPLLSIITIVYNGDQHLEQTICSVLNQSFKNIQYIVIDGGSTDQSINIIRKYEKDLYYWLSEKDQGISDAFNKGLAKATGDIIGIINADDWYEEGALEKVATQMGEADVCFGDVQLWRNEKKEFLQKANLDWIEREMTINHPTVFIKRKTYETYGGFSEQYRCAMDFDMILKLKVNNCTFKYLPDTLANMRWGGFSDNAWKLGCRETLEIKNKYLPAHRLKHRLYYFKHIAAIQSAKTLSALNLSFVTQLYRKYFSGVKKIYND